jgi:hypothetical protein
MPDYRRVNTDYSPGAIGADVLALLRHRGAGH